MKIAALKFHCLMPICFLFATGALLTPASLCSQVVRFAIIGDYGRASQPEQEVATLVKGWNPDFVITTGDNNYEYGESATIDQNIGQYYREFISPYTGSYGAGDTINRFFPCPGNHDWVAAGAAPYFNYFTLPGNERYYDVLRGPVHLFSIDSDPHEPDGNTSSSVQAAWLRNALAASSAPWKIVYLHHAPYSSGSRHGSNATLQWPFKAWGATAVLAGHEHFYERLSIDGLLYFVNGAGGKDLYTFGTPIAGSQARFNADFGAMEVIASADSISFSFITRIGTLVDSYSLFSPALQIHQVAIRRGWNLLSVPLQPEHPLATEVFPGSSTPIYHYTNGLYEHADSLSPGTGYWCKFPTDGIVMVPGSMKDRDTIELRTGWNLFGTISDTLPTTSIIQIPDGIVVSSYFGYDGNYATVEKLVPWRGYWVRAGAPGKLVLGGSR